MPSFEQLAISDLISLISTTWPEAGSSIFKSNQLNGRLLKDFLEDGQIQPPFAVMSFGTSVLEDWGLDNEAYRLPVTVNYFAKVSDPRGALQGGGFDVANLVLGQLILLREALVSFSGNFQLAGALPQISINNDNGDNKDLTMQRIDLFTGYVQANLLMGQVTN